MEIKRFTVFSQDGTRGYIEIGDINKIACIKVYVKELKIGKNTIKENCIATVAHTSRSQYPVLRFKDDKMLKISNPEMIDFISQKSGENIMWR